MASLGEIQKDTSNHRGGRIISRLRWAQANISVTLNIGWDARPAVYINVDLPPHEVSA